MTERWRRKLARRTDPRVPFVRLSGSIGRGPTRTGISHQQVEPLLTQAFETKRAVAVALVVNSPGGSPAQSSLIASRIRDLSARHELPVLAFVEDLAASGGYWLATAADEIFADRTSLVGSIGAISMGFGFQEVLRKIGVERRIRAAGENKGMLDPFSAERPEDVVRIEAILAELHAAFIDWVRQRRGGRLADDEGEIFSGAVWIASKAHEFGLIDGIGHLDAVVRERYGDDVRIEEIKPRRRLGLRLLGGGLVRNLDETAETVAAGVVDGVLDRLDERAAEGSLRI